MKRNYLLATISLLAAALLVGGCSQEETTVTDGTTLPEGMYPLTFTAVQTGDGLATRVEDDPKGMSSKWSDGDKIKVQIADGEEGTYTLDESGVATAVKPCYWQNTNTATINAWYSNITGHSTTDNTVNTVNLADQSKGLAYVLKVEDPVKTDYKNKNISLPFKHQLAKVRVTLEGDKALDVSAVRVKGYTSCTVEKGVVKDGNTQDYISMCKNGGYWEANLVPMTGINADDFIKLNGKVQAKVTGVSQLEAGNVYGITINAESKDFTVTGDYTIEGEHKPIIITGNYTVTFKDARITSDDRPVVKINDGCRPTLVFEGENVLKGNITSGQDDEYSIKLENDAKLAVISEGTPIGSTYNRIRLKISGNGEMWVQSNGHDSPAIIVRDGSLDVSGGVNLTAVSTNISWGNIGNLDYIPAIGRAAYSSGVIGGNITLSNCTLKLYAWAKGDKEPQNWVTLENGTVTPNVDGELKSAEWNTEVSLDNNVKATKLKDRPELPDWVK